MIQYKFQPGTNEKIFYRLTVNDDGKMKLVFRGMDRAIEYDAHLNDKEWVEGDGFLFPPLTHKKWMKLE